MEITNLGYITSKILQSSSRLKAIQFLLHEGISPAEFLDQLSKRAGCRFMRNFAVYFFVDRMMCHKCGVTHSIIENKVLGGADPTMVYRLSCGHATI